MINEIKSMWFAQVICEKVNMRFIWSESGHEIRLVVKFKHPNLFSKILTRIFIPISTLQTLILSGRVSCVQSSSDIFVVWCCILQLLQFLQLESVLCCQSPVWRWDAKIDGQNVIIIKPEEKNYRHKLWCPLFLFMKDKNIKIVEPIIMLIQ